MLKKIPSFEAHILNIFFSSFNLRSLVVVVDAMGSTVQNT
jgi:hypothetical protein